MAFERAVLVHGLPDTLLAFASAQDSGSPLLLISAPGAAAYAGPGWFLGIVEAASKAHPSVTYTAVLDCDDRAGDVQGALAAGVADVLFVGREDVTVKLRSIAQPRGASIWTTRPPALDLRGRPGAGAVCRAWLAGMTVPEV